ncbi:MAG TPA: DUF1569 domain-containing protein [Flavobacterium sp.]|jgi:hypothetical protein|uniref:DUF1569 domain-containing protein n=1 Tax=Flavobacterium sp. TaxID=239 RepID=UPI002C86E798|nr:DUF1569 domain-containing protein [Flavobacterium sp.]HPW97821.1 DUF1569 domain-containing protein [Flavobacterium sp.]HQA74218.1 DUF1569 domain-containing protein [Flavobacterium sp.]
MEKLKHYINRIEEKLPLYETSNLAVSKSAIGWHIDHSFKVINAVVTALKNSKPEEYQWKFNKIRLLIYTIGVFPRGKVKAPKSVQSYETIFLNDLILQFETAKSGLLTLKHLDKNANFNHPIFGQLNLKQTIYFLQLHTKHHLKIMDDILKK